MALQITGNIELQGGISIPSCYGRTTFQLAVNGDRVDNIVEFYKDEASYTSGAGQIYPTIGYNSVLPYDRLVDGTDLLSFTNEKIKEQLEGQGYSVVITEL